MKIIIAAGTGFLGRNLEKYFEEKNNKVKILTRNPTNQNEIYWDAKTLGNWNRELENSDVLINLASIFLKTETELMLKSRNVYPEALLKNGFQFQFPSFKEALRQLV